MTRDLEWLSDSTFDLLVIGAGINGVWAAWDAALRGLAVALVDRGDFGGGTSANSLKVIHGGLRYLQQLDLRRMRESIRERSTLARVAPAYVRPMPFLVPTGGGPHRGRAAFEAALSITAAMGFDRNRGLPANLILPPGRTITAGECVRLMPGANWERVTGGAIWYDYQLHRSERLPVAIAVSAAEHGACVANHVGVRELLVDGGVVRGARARDMIDGVEFDIQARMVLNAAGPWAPEIAASAVRGPAPTPGVVQRPMALAINLVSRRPVLELGVALRSRTTAAEDPVFGGGRFLFMVPWRDRTLIGTAYSIAPFCDRTRPRELEDRIRAFVSECNAACPGLELSMSDVTYFHHGWLPLNGTGKGGRAEALAGTARILDHSRTHGVEGLISIEGVKYTTARLLAKRSVDLVFRKLRQSSPPCRTASVPLIEGDPEPTDCAPVPRARVLHAIRNEMALKLGDVVLRRTEIGGTGRPCREHLNAIADVCAEELGWDATRRRSEIDEVDAVYQPVSGL